MGSTKKAAIGLGVLAVLVLAPLVAGLFGQAPTTERARDEAAEWGEWLRGWLGGALARPVDFDALSLPPDAPCELFRASQDEACLLHIDPGGMCSVAIGPDPEGERREARLVRVRGDDVKLWKYTPNPGAEDVPTVDPPPCEEDCEAEEEAEGESRSLPPRSGDEEPLRLPVGAAGGTLVLKCYAPERSCQVDLGGSEDGKCEVGPGGPG